MAENTNNNGDFELNNFESLQIKLASTDKILEWSHGEVTKPETINYRTLKPERDGLFCERIFGPMKDWECHCGKYKRIRYKGIVCDRCGVEVTKAKVRRERMGHIKLAAPVSHIWYFKGIPSRMGLILDITPRNLERVLYFASYIVLDAGDPADDTGLVEKQILGEQEYREKKDQFGNKFRAAMGAEAVRELLAKIDLDALSTELREALKNSTGQKKVRVIRRLEVVEALRLSGNRPEWMVLEVVPVIPPDLRPMVQLDGGRFATSDLNDLYRRVINRNNRLKRLLELGAPDIIVRNEKRMLQEAVDSLIDNGRRGRPVTGPGGRALKSLSDMLKGKQGRFRQNLLGKRVDYSGRSVIVVGPELKFYQCGLPKKMALELFKPFIMKELVEKGYAHNIKNAKRMVEKVKPEVWDVLEDVIKEHPVMLNRAPTLHRLGIQAFEPVLVEGKAIKLHPLACTAFNADFDGDQMAVHVPLSVEAQAEARFLMLSVNNILAPKDGSPITTPTQDMILGAYYLTYPGTCKKVTEAGGKEKVAYAMDEFNDRTIAKANKEAGFERVPEKGDGKVFTDMDEMIMAYQNGVVKTHAKVKVRRYLDENDTRGKLVESTVGRFIYNQGIPQDIGFVDRSNDKYRLEIDFLCGKKKLGEIIDKCYRAHENTGTVIMLDYIKSMGYKYSTKAAVSIGIDDMKIPDNKWEIVDAAQAEIDKYEQAYRVGLISNEERFDKLVEVWNKATDDVADALMDSLEPDNNLNIMATSGARGSKNQIRQIGGMRGLMATATGKTVEIPIKANFREGLSILEYFISSNGARKGLADTALRTADSGYLTRRLVDVSHNVIVRDYDCGTNEGVEVSAFTDGKEVLERLEERVAGRTAAEDVKNPTTGELIVAKNEEITDEQAHEIEISGIETVKIRSVMTCKSRSGICAKCYGRNLATGEEVNIGESVGITAAQSIGEPGTQLTMRTFHTGGVAGSDITHGLPRVEELFEARKPKGLAEICEEDGTVQKISVRPDNKTEVIVLGEDGEKEYIVPYGARIAVREGEEVKAGGNITSGPLNPHDIFRLKGVEGVYDYLLMEVQRVYKNQGVDINDKHVEIIVSQMLSKYKIEDPGDTDLLPGGMYSIAEIADANKEAEEKDGAPANGKQLLLGITKASLATNSFLSAASFQETTRVLTDAAIKGKTDRLQGLKENVIIGKLIPAGTGMKRYKNIKIDYGENTEYMNSFDKKPENTEYVKFDSNKPESRYEDFEIDEKFSDEDREHKEETPDSGTESEIVELD
ncbi:DNA-directed RNA polymerase subunit beta' [Aminicella lysinilytica]|uniref:DNA-directed RNA polymerase subunit beta' n=1 Tax=Aminicella lysinilytica TaxID=433323 RepID=UPI0026ED7BC7|nr:DNA-directed RNA polymerase subunit beta' [Aminicella lysinilytica]